MLPGTHLVGTGGWSANPPRQPVYMGRTNTNRREEANQPDTGEKTIKGRPAQERAEERGSAID